MSRKKTAAINLMVDTDTKKKLKQKATESNCKTLTEFLEKIAEEGIIFMSNDVKTLLRAMK